MKQQSGFAWKIGCMAFLLLAFCLLYQVSKLLKNHISEEAAIKIHYGMTYDVVESLLGRERDETEGRTVVLLPPSSRNSHQYLDYHHWISSRAAITVGFDKETGHVVEVWYQIPTIWDPTLWDRIEELVHSETKKDGPTYKMLLVRP